jgi:hypothetical protein
MLEAAHGEGRVFPATTLYNENWLLRVVLHWFATHDPGPHQMAFSPGARWFSEAWLPSAFLPRQRRPRDLLAEGWTHADGVIGHLRIGAGATADLSLSATASQLVVIEAKVYSRLSLGVRNAPYYDQAARTVGCIAEVLRRANRPPAAMAELAFHVIAPKSRIQAGVFTAEVNPQSVEGKVRRRVEEYGGARNGWMETAFAPVMRRPIAISCLTWEDIIDRIRDRDSQSGGSIGEFYQRCLDFGQLAENEGLADPGAAPDPAGM